MTRSIYCMLALAALAGVARADEFPSDAAPAARVASREAYATAGDQRLRVAAIEVRSEATVNDANVTLRQVCRWSDADENAFEPFADLIVARLGTRGFATITIETLRSTLRDAGLPPSRVNIAGSTSCTVTRSDVTVDEAAALQAWSGQPALNGEPARREIVAAHPEAPAAAAGDGDDLKSKLIADVAQRLKLPVDTLQVDFRPEDRRLLSMGAPFEFTIEPQRHGDLGEVSWLVTVSGAGKPTLKNDVGDGRRVRIVATARAWMDQAVATRALATREEIAAGDIETRRVLADRLPSDAWVTQAQAVGQQAAREVRPGTVLSTKLVAPVELVRPGQLVTILSRRGVVEVKSVARAMQSGTMGQVVKVKNETTGELFSVTMTARQTASLGDPTPTVADAR